MRLKQKRAEQSKILYIRSEPEVKPPFKERVRYMFRIMTNPFEALYEIRYRNYGSLLLAFLCIFVLSVSFTMNRIYAGFIVNDINPRYVDALTDLTGIVVVLGLFCLGNWSVTSLLDGEGRMRDIVTVMGYAMLPIIFVLIPATIISNIVAEEEAALYFLLIGIGLAWTGILLLVGIMTIHNYTFLKTLITVVLTFIAVLIIVFITLLIFDLINQIYMFLYSIYTELIFRF